MNASLQVSHFVPMTVVDGPGARSSLYLQGCSLGRTSPCPGCQNSKLFPKQGGVNFDVEHVAAMLLGTGLPITIIGGEPLDQALPLAVLLDILKDAGRHIVIYSGYTWEELIDRGAREPGLATCLILADVLVDGRWDYTQTDPFVQYRGSRNQRVIDLPATWRRGGGKPVLLDWDIPTFTIDAEGGITASDGLIALIQETNDTVETALRCGQVA